MMTDFIFATLDKRFSDTWYVHCMIYYLLKFHHDSPPRTRIGDDRYQAKIDRKEKEPPFLTVGDSREIGNHDIITNCVVNRQPYALKILTTH